MKVCICCGHNEFGVAPRWPYIVAPKGKIRDSKIWCNNCWDYTELVSEEEYKTGYHLDTELKRLVLKALNCSRMKKSAAKLLGIPDRTLFRKIDEYKIVKTTKGYE